MMSEHKVLKLTLPLNQQIATPIRGFVDDYAFLVRALLDLYEATLEPEWMSWAAELQRRQDELFWDQDGGEESIHFSNF